MYFPFLIPGADKYPEERHFLSGWVTNEQQRTGRGARGVLLAPWEEGVYLCYS